MPSNVPLTMGTRQWLTLGFLSLLWGGSFFFIEVSVSEVPTFSLVLSRVALAAIALWLVILIKRIPVPRDTSIWLAFLFMGLLNNAIPFSLIVWGQAHISSGLAAILNANTPLFTALVASIFLSDERLTRARLVSLLMGLAGVALMFGKDLMSGLHADLLAQFAILGAAMSYAFAGVFGRRFARLNVHPIVAAAGQVTASSIWLFPLVMYLELGAYPLNLGTSVILSLLALALLSTALAYVLYFQLLATAGATNLLLVTLLVPVSAILLGSTFLDEQLSWQQLAGMVLIGSGLLLMDPRISRRFKRLS